MNIVIMGGGKVGESLARRILEGRRHEVRIIESDRARSLQLANALDVEIICGDGTNIDMLENAGVRDADCFIAISGDDANNLVASQLAKQYFGAKKVIARANDPRNLETMRVLGVDYAVSSTEIIAQMIEQEANLLVLPPDDRRHGAFGVGGKFVGTDTGANRCCGKAIHNARHGRAKAEPHADALGVECRRWGVL